LNLISFLLLELILLYFDFLTLEVVKMSAEKNVILVTGGTGLVGQGIKYIVEIEEKNENDSYIFLSSKDVDLT
jgi:hypothetical protein